MNTIDRITVDPNIMDGLPCVRGLPVTVRSVAHLIENGATTADILGDYPYLEADDISAVLAYVENNKQVLDQSGRRSDPKPRSNHQRRLQILRSMDPAQKLKQVFKLNERMLKLFRIGLRRRFPDLSEPEFEKVYLQMRERCHNRNY